MSWSSQGQLLPFRIPIMLIIKHRAIEHRVRILELEASFLFYLIQVIGWWYPMTYFGTQYWICQALFFPYVSFYWRPILYKALWGTCKRYNFYSQNASYIWIWLPKLSKNWKEKHDGPIEKKPHPSLCSASWQLTSNMIFSRVTWKSQLPHGNSFPSWWSGGEINFVTAKLFEAETAHTTTSATKS